MNAEALIRQLGTLGVEIFPQGGNLVIRPASKVPSELKAQLRQHKPEILAALSHRPATCSPSCYVVEHGLWIHHPWDGCKTPAKVAPPSKRWVSGRCWHCRGLKNCHCIVCWQDVPGECVVCHGSGEALRWAQ